MEVPQNHFNRVIAHEMSLGASYEEAVEIVENTLIGHTAQLHDAVDYVIYCLEQTFRFVKND